VPSNWELQGFGTYNYGHDWRDKNIKLGQEEGLYRYRFEVPADWKGKTVQIVFDGSMTDTEVKINGRVAGPSTREASYPFQYAHQSFLKYNRSKPAGSEGGPNIRPTLR
jgi:beta-galactosidase/beta-glucuronidase